MSIYLPPDIEDFLTGWLRERIPNISVRNKEPQELHAPLDKPLVVIRDDSGTRTSLVTWDRSVGVSVLAGSKSYDKPANDLARLVYAHLTDDAVTDAPGSPIAAVLDEGCNGPYAVQDDQDVARRYMTIEYSVTGEQQ
ncbi:phage protein [Bifidobacterium actinocoloniiforme DSM 22766]|uniref:Phage protein n=1 Tax=Bifidobacterium actinocoloniiforme DSM 22766 TaxID=1437605 RepID=A0A086Z1G7_9BIFI|nr:hypothetical protein [Bifidobacterium actinocoloniiforme]AKV55510.1 hypothetical protein AB656_03970 [Bifidobacterium actinocoloniiforme DSM 22766]KFI40367.1 phage protein [Bifidobacterium actinocoloniiforme DSM 22766]